jgi:hypothetical protein
VVAGVALVSVGCSPSRSESSTQEAPDPPAAAPSDSLVLTTTGGHQVWLVGGRSAEDSSGTSCLERGVEIRRDTSRILVPLLFVTEPPTELNQTEIRAELSRHCRTMATYRVELATGRPRKVEDR